MAGMDNTGSSATALTGNTGLSSYGNLGGFLSGMIGQLIGGGGQQQGGMLPAFGQSAENILGNAAGTMFGSVANSVGKSIINNAGKRIAGKTVGLATKAGLKEGFKDLGGAAGVGSMAMGVADSLMGAKSEYSGDYGSLTQGVDSAYNTIASGVSVIPGVGTSLGLGMQGAALLGKGLNKWTGSGTDGMTSTDAILGSSFLNLTPMGLINGWGGKKSHKMGLTDWMSQDKLTEEWNGYAGSLKNDLTAQTKANKKYGLFSGGARRKANKMIGPANMNRTDLLAMQQDKEIGNIRGNQMVSINNERYMQDLQGGISPDSMHMGRRGIKLPTVSEIKKIKQLTNKISSFSDKQTTLKQWGKQSIQLQSEKNIQDIHDVTKVPQMKQGGEVPYLQSGGSVNVIPEGALHARLNKMEGGGKDFTKKGIPVVDINGEQQAEIENNEIIFRKEVTDKIEELAKDGSDQAAIECGKLLTKEIIENTEDRTGLLQSAKNGGILKADDGMFVKQLREEKSNQDYLNPIMPFKAEKTINTMPSSYQKQKLSGSVDDINKLGSELSPKSSKNTLTTDQVKDSLKQTAITAGKQVLAGISGVTKRKKEIADSIESKKDAILDASKKYAWNALAQSTEASKIAEQQLGYGSNYVKQTLDNSQNLDSDVQKELSAALSDIDKKEKTPDSAADLDKQIAALTAKRDSLLSAKDGEKLNFKGHPAVYTEKPTYEEWIKFVNPSFLSQNYDLKEAFQSQPIEQLERWRDAVNNYGIYGDTDPRSINFVDKNNINPNHLRSYIELNNGILKSLKLGTEEENKELIPVLQEIKGKYIPMFHKEENRYYFIPAEFNKDENRYYFKPAKINK